jgi:hypothetical protein
MIQQGQTTSFKGQILEGIHDLLTDEIKIALYTANADLGPTTTVYSATDEVISAGYTPGGEVLTGVTVATSGTTAYVDFNNVNFVGCSFTCRGALIYNHTKGDKSIAVLDFGSDKTATPTTIFRITMPANTASDALIRIA